MRRFFKYMIIILLLFVTSFMVPAVFADDGANTGNSGSDSGTVTLTNPLKVDSIGGLVQNFVEIFSYLVILAAVLFLIWTGLQFILARGNPERMNELKNQLFWTIVGIAVVIGARLIIQVVINTLSASGAIEQGTIRSVQKALDRN